MARRPPTFLQRARAAGLIRRPRTVRADTASQREADRLRSTARWRAVRLQALRRDKFLCQHCLRDDRTTPATTVDHIVPLQQDPGGAFVLANLQSLCGPCHGKKSAAERRGS